MRYYLIAALLSLSSHSYSQQLSQVSFAQASDFLWFTILTNQNVLVRIANDGKILESGTEQASNYNRNFFAPNLLPYAGVINYYQHEPDSSLNGKIKNIGTCYFTYYGANDYPERAGKIKTAGSISFDYYRKYEDGLIAGRIKSIGSNAITYYASFDNESLRGKLKSVGNTAITYYSAFDNQSLTGKLKSIGPSILQWSSTFAGSQFVSYLKTGNQRQFINGVTFIIQ